MRTAHSVSRVAAGLAVLTALGASPALAQQDAGRAAFRALYKDMVETDSSPTTGSCTKVVTMVEGRLKAAGYTSSDYELVIPPGKPDDGNIVARLKAANPTKKPVLLLGHIDVVAAFSGLRPLVSTSGLRYNRSHPNIEVATRSQP